MASKFVFTVLPPGASIPPAANFCAYLREDNWNDWFKYRTMYDLVVFDEDGSRKNMGAVKIGQVGQPPDKSHPNLPKTFTKLGPHFVSLGQSNSYYEKLGIMSVSLRQLLVLVDFVISSPVRGR